MNKIYQKGDIIFLRNYKFEDGKFDLNINGHPYLLLDDVYYMNQVVRALKITTKFSKYTEVKLSKNTLWKVSYVDTKVRNICVNRVSFPESHISEHDYQQLKTYFY